MTRPCEVCSSLLISGQRTPLTPGRMRRALFGDRIVALCDTHARAAKEAGIEDLTDLRRLFPELEGKRSHVGRRTPLDRRVFPPRPEGRRRNRGRRASDPVS